MLTSATPTNFPNMRKHAKPQRHQISRAEVRWKFVYVWKPDRTEPIENQRRRGGGGGRWSKRQAVPFLAISISSSVQRDVSPASTAPATHTVSVSKEKLEQRYTTRLISHPPSLSVYTRVLRRPPPSSRPSLPPTVSLYPSSTAFCPLPRLLLSLPAAYWTRLGRLPSLFLARSLGESPVSWSQADSGGVQKHHPSGSKTSTHTLTHSPISLGSLSHNSSWAEASSATTPPYVISTQTTARARERERQRQRERQPVLSSPARSEGLLEID